MDVLQALKGFKIRLDAELEAYFDKVVADAREKDVFTADVLEHCQELALAGGKRLRPALMYYGYLAVGGAEEEKMLRASMSVELVHTFLLMHDDIIDRDGLRHGVETLHRERLFPGLENAHFGTSIALIAGDMVGALGNQILFESEFDPKLVLRALSKLQSIVALTVVGQTKDLYIEYAKEASEEEILRMYEYKTARYTVEGPLHLGAILGGASGETLEGFSRYAIPIGTAFQIQDDILGVFGSEEKLGKSVGSDIQEGKFTLLVSKAFRELPSQGRKEFRRLLRKGDALTEGDADRFREILRETGSLDYARALAQGYISEGKNAMLELPGIRPEAREFFLGIADYMAQREC
jgi:geranylgeranyl diphosphate synthase type I